VHPGFVDGIEMLPMPRAADLPYEQIEGDRCVWCGSRPETELGPRISVIDGALFRWHPRACRECVREQAAKVYDTHIRTCAYCTPTCYCIDARALYRLALTAASVSDRGRPETE
jgi:hypothetical protein